MSPYTNCHAPRISLSVKIQIGQKSGYYLFIIFIYLFIYLFRVNIKPPRHRFGFSLAWDWQFKTFKTFKTNFKLMHAVVGCAVLSC
jgi:hypothetical protein